MQANNSHLHYGRVSVWPISRLHMKEVCSVPDTALSKVQGHTDRISLVLCHSLSEAGRHTYSHCHQMITQQWPKGPWGSSEVTQKSRFFMIFSFKPAKSSLVGPHRGADLGKSEISPGIPSSVGGP